MLWWGRFGKMTGFLSIATLIAEILGADVIRNFGRSLRLFENSELDSFFDAIVYRPLEFAGVLLTLVSTLPVIYPMLMLDVLDGKVPNKHKAWFNQPSF